MIVGRLCITYPRGLKSNKAKDVGLSSVPTNTEDGGVVRGLGTHFTSEEAKERVKDCEKYEYQIRSTFKENFVSAPIPSMFILPDRYAGEQCLNRITRAIGSELRGLAISCRVVTYDLGIIDELPSAEVQEWKDRIKRQLTLAPLGRAKDAKASGLGILESLASCPVLAEETRTSLNDLIGLARLGTLDRLDFKRQIELIDVEVDVGPVVAPRRAEVDTSTPLDELSNEDGMVSPRGDVAVVTDGALAAWMAGEE